MTERDENLVIRGLRRIRPRTRALAVSGAVRRAAIFLRSVPRLLHEAARRLRWRVEVTRLSVRPPHPDLLAGTLDDGEVPIVMCLWRRPWRIDAILDQLARQSDCPPLRLILWNNEPGNDTETRRAIAEFSRRDSTGAVQSVEYHCSPVNIGGIARFVVARAVARGALGKPFIMLDDDQDVSDHFVRDLLGAFAPRTYAGIWAFSTGQSYWDRVEAADGDIVNYVGTGGSVCDVALVADRRFFRLPARFGFIEDLWASYVAASRGWTLKKIETPFELLDESGNQYHALRDRKDGFHRYLRERMARGDTL